MSPREPSVYRRRALTGSCYLLVLALVACDPSDLLVDAAPPPDRAVLSLAVAPALAAGIGTAQAFTAANQVRVQLVRDNTIVMDTVLDFSAGAGGSSEVLLTIDRNLIPAVVLVDVELRRDRSSILRGSRTIHLQPRHLTEVEIDLLPANPTPLATVVQLSAGILHSCAVLGGSQAVCWGDNLFGHLGDGSRGMRLTPSAVAGPVGFQRVVAGYVSSCGLGTDQRIYCWGDNQRGVLGTTASAQSTTPVPVSTNLTFRQLVLAGLHACGLTEAGQAFCWGYNEFGQLGDGSNTDRPVPTAAAGALRFQSLSAGYLHTCGLTLDGGTYCWGHNEQGQLGDGSQVDHNSPVRISNDPGFAALSAGGLHTCGRVADGRAYCWGYNQFGQLGSGGAGDSRTTPEQVAGSVRFGSLAAGGGHTCGLSQDSQVFCWGYNHSGPLGTGTLANSSEPAPVLRSLRAQQVVTGLHHTCALSLDNVAMCWGFNTFGQLGDRSTISSPEPGFVFHEESPLFSSAAHASRYPNDPFRVLPGLDL